MHGNRIMTSKTMRIALILTGIFSFLAVNVRAEIVYELDFSTAEGDAKAWFEEQGWEYRKDADDMNTRFEDGRFIIEPDDDDLGVIATQFTKETALNNVRTVRIEWGVEQYPKGADWTGPKTEKRNTREAVSLMIFFGDEKVDSGSIAVPDLPYFISFFLGEKEKQGEVYYGNYWQEGGRYLCEPCDGSVNTTFVTEVNIDEKFREFFNKETPPVTGLTIEIDNQKTEKVNGRHSKAFIRKIQLLDS